MNKPAEIISETIVEATIRNIREAVHSGRFASGEHLVVADLQTMFGVSAGPVREALRRLAGEGLVDILPHRGAMVRQLSARDVRDYFQLREGIEGVAARLAAENISHSGYSERLSVVLHDLRSATSGEGGDLSVARQTFHDLLYEMSGNRRLREVAQQLTYPTFALRYRRLLPGRAQASLQEHENIIKAILAGDGILAERLMRAHLRNAEHSIREVLESDPEFHKAFFGDTAPLSQP